MTLDDFFRAADWWAIALAFMFCLGLFGLLTLTLTYGRRRARARRQRPIVQPPIAPLSEEEIFRRFTRQATFSRTAAKGIHSRRGNSDAA